jgi:rubrerythrin
VSTFEVLKRAERIEAIAASIYGFFAKQFADDPKVRALFARLEAEELQHASRVRLLASSYRSDSKVLGTLTVGPELEACVAQAEAALAEVQAGRWGKDLPAIADRLSLLEHDLAKAHAQILAQDANPALRDFFRQLAQQDEAHVALLRAT